MSRVAKQYRLSEGEVAAIHALAQAGHVLEPENFKGRTEIGVMRKLIRDAWAIKFPGQQFPTGAETTNGGKK